MASAFDSRGGARPGQVLLRRLRLLTRAGEAVGAVAEAPAAGRGGDDRRARAGRGTATPARECEPPC